MKKSIVALFAICSLAIASCGGNSGKVEEAKELTDDLVEDMNEAAEPVEEVVDSVSTELEAAE